MASKHYFTSESVTEGHPDKICDQISDAVLDSIIADDHDARVACETLVTTGLVMVAGEITTTTYVDIPEVVRNVVKRIGYTDATYGFDYETCAVLTSKVGNPGKDNNGLVAVWPEANTQGAWDMGLRPAPAGMAAALKDAGAAYIVASDLARNNPELAQALEALDFVVVQELYLTDTAKAADVVLPVRSFIEREGTFTSGDRRVQRGGPVGHVGEACSPTFAGAGKSGLLEP